MKPARSFDQPYLADRADQVIAEVRRELWRAIEKHGPMKSGHEGYAVILEELEELWHEVKLDVPRPGAQAFKEAIQIAAMAVRFVVDLREMHDGKT